MNPLEIRVTSICTLLNVFCNMLTELLDTSFDGLTVGTGLLGIRHVF
jgi:hypothetical protein